MAFNLLYSVLGITQGLGCTVPLSYSPTSMLAVYIQKKYGIENTLSISLRTKTPRSNRNVVSHKGEAMWLLVRILSSTVVT